MSFIVFLVLLPFIHSQIIPEPRIIGGHAHDIKDYPYLVSIVSNDVTKDETRGFAISSSFCTGSLLTVDWVITAGHCITVRLVTQEGPGAGIYVRMGSNDRLQFGFLIQNSKPEDINPNAQERKIIQAVAYPKYVLGDRMERRYDSGLMKTDKPFEIKPLVQLALFSTELGWTDSHCGPNVTLTSAGWGSVEGDNGPNVTDDHLYKIRPLKRAFVNLFPLNRCKEELFGSSLDDSCLCTMGSYFEQGPCVGDSGGPLMCEGKVIATVSGGWSTCGKEYDGGYDPHLYMKIEKYWTWIGDVTGNPKLFFDSPLKKEDPNAAKPLIVNIVTPEEMKLVNMTEKSRSAKTEEKEEIGKNKTTSVSLDSCLLLFSLIFAIIGVL